MNESYYTPEQVAEKLGMHVKTIQRYLRTGILPATRIGSRWRVSARDLATFTQANRMERSAPPERGIRVSSVLDIPTKSRDEAIRIVNTLTAALNAKPPEYGQSSMTAQFIESENMVRVALWGALRFTQAMLESIDMLTAIDQEGEQ